MFYGYKYVTVAEKKEKAEKKLKKLRKKNPNIKPITVTGRKLAKTWWGHAWNENLENYSDYESRIPRGRTYVRNGLVLDLQIKKGVVTALVMGSRSRVYTVEVTIKKISSSKVAEIKDRCKDQIESLQDLLDGNFPEDLNDIFTTPKTGLFPNPTEIEFSCSCPDWADMCKHVAATLYGIGARFDEDPKLFFKLRQMNIKSLIKEAVKKRTKKLLKSSKEKSSRAIKEDNLEELFNIDLE